MTTERNFPWASDVKISMPQPCDDPDGVSVSFGGIGFTPMGMRFDYTQAERDQFYSSLYAPSLGPSR